MEKFGTRDDRNKSHGIKIFMYWSNVVKRGHKKVDVDFSVNSN